MDVYADQTLLDAIWGRAGRVPNAPRESLKEWRGSGEAPEGGPARAERVALRWPGPPDRAAGGPPDRVVGGGCRTERPEGHRIGRRDRATES
ncbi:hypothetical protein GCM10009654_37330 [Streptomyces hebeiensis]|uniref:Uncharacterized protein n=1 Tax=Streptomyces hebeiensis TaxID=229486 RepID=A0ABN1UXK1_9ACTN